MCRRNPYFRIFPSVILCPVCPAVWQSLTHKPFQVGMSQIPNVDMLRHVRKGRLGSRTGKPTVEANAALGHRQLLGTTHTYMQLDLRRTRGNNEREIREDYWRRPAPSKPDFERFLLSKQGSDYIFLEHRMVQSRIQQRYCTSIIWWSAQGTRKHTARWTEGGRWAVKETAPTPQPPSPFQTFLWGYLHFLKTCRFEVLNGKHHFRTWILSETFWKWNIFSSGPPNRSQAVYVQ